MQTTLDDELINKTIELNKTTGSIDENGLIVAPEKVVIPLEITDNRNEITEMIKNNLEITHSILQTVSVEIKKTVKLKFQRKFLLLPLTNLQKPAIWTKTTGLQSQ